MSDATPGDAAKAPARPPSEIIADIRQERAALSGTFDSLRTDLGEAVEVGKEKGKEVGKKAAVVGPPSPRASQPRAPPRCCCAGAAPGADAGTRPGSPCRVSPGALSCEAL